MSGCYEYSNILYGIFYPSTDSRDGNVTVSASLYQNIINNKYKLYEGRKEGGWMLACRFPLYTYMFVLTWSVILVMKCDLGVSPYNYRGQCTELHQVWHRRLGRAEDSQDNLPTTQELWNVTISIQCLLQIYFPLSRRHSWRLLKTEIMD